MLVELTSGQQVMLAQMVDAAIEELGPEIHHTFRSGYRTELRERRQELLAMRPVLAEGKPAQVGAGMDTAARGLVGTP